MRLPEQRGPITRHLQVMRTDPTGIDVDKCRALLDDIGEPMAAHEDVQLALWTLNELHYQGFSDVDAEAAWAPELITVRALLEHRFEAELREMTVEPVRAAWDEASSVAERIFALVRNDTSPRLAAYVQREITAEHFLELLRHRSVYHLKEADPHTFAVPHLQGRAKAALVEIQFDEYGSGRPADMHSALFAQTMGACGLDETYGAYVDQVPGYTLAGSNAMSLFGLHRRLTAAACGHLAAFEATSSLANRRYAAGVRRLGFGDSAARYFDEHVEADAVHEQVAAREMCGALVEDDPASQSEILFGAAACLVMDGLAAERQLNAWRCGGSALLPAAG
jgi:hypothetical protein